MKAAFPSGLDRTSPEVRAEVRERWADAVEEPDRSDWVWWLLGSALGWGEHLVTGDAVPGDLRHEVIEHDVTLRPDGVLLAHRPGAEEDVARVLVMVVPRGTKPFERVAARAGRPRRCSGWPCCAGQRTAHWAW